MQTTPTWLANAHIRKPDYLMTDESKVVSIGKSEADKAADYKKRAAELLEPFCRLRDEAMRDGLLIGFGGVAVAPSGRNEVIDLHVMKRF